MTKNRLLIYGSRLSEKVCSKDFSPRFLSTEVLTTNPTKLMRYTNILGKIRGVITPSLLLMIWMFMICGHR
ncbi:hypothetical protein NIES4072_43050 [Nostoc commune NIES-4072]|uniref:Uncharacterized protein n=1 Tax=Nostoc commune NIES-4072 TaxID=2005467 RepID=A0A2R5FY83_NOSCO|nr:hypothetical protein NIES4070_47780 [Nostoc commune HK-02]GBG20624.1 hypothetical protein NIES4072_43050 [Nostoc commune NIES-4072]